MKKLIAAIAITASMIVAPLSLAFAAPANAACTTFDEHQKVVFTNCSPNAGPATERVFEVPAGSGSYAKSTTWQGAKDNIANGKTTDSAGNPQ